MSAEQPSLDLNEQLARFPGVDLDPRGNTCWWVVIAGEQVGWVRRTIRDTFSGTLQGRSRMRRSVARARKEIVHQEFVQFDDAVRFVVAEHEKREERDHG